MVTLNGKGRAGRLWVLGLLTGVAFLGSLVSADAQEPVAAASDRPAGYVVLPKIVVHTTGGSPAVLPGGAAYDTIIQMTNTDETAPINVNCWWVNANNYCGGNFDPSTGSGIVCNTLADCPLGLPCLPTWSERDFSVTLSQGQPIAFNASTGLGRVPCDPLDPRTCPGTSGGLILPVSDDPFRGELKCVQVDDDDDPVPANNLKIEATIVSTTVPGGIMPTLATTSASYNGIGFEADEAFTPTENPSDPLCLGSLPVGTAPPTQCNQEYAPCPGVLILNHFFERATPEIGGVVNTELTLVPCSEDLGNPVVSANFQVLAQMLIFNEFEQRFSSAATVECYRSTTLSDIDTLPGPSGDSFSIFSAGVQGTLTGQTRIKGQQGAPGRLGYGLLGVACEQYRESVGSPVLATTAFNLHHDNFNPNGDAVYLELLPE